MTTMSPKEVLARYLADAHDALRWKLDGLSGYNLRRPLTPTGTNLLGIAKHLALVEAGYLGDVFGRPSGLEMPEGANADMYADANESVADILGLLRQAQDHGAATIEALDLDAEGHVPWWGDNNPVTLHHILVHLITDFQRHLGHADILREQLDGATGLLQRAGNLPELDDGQWAAHVDRLETLARHADQSESGAP